ncbi:hypothetical protein A2U01_0027960, partial [Trifolium medium]|nr:hypothetical protein [Trifolium medium]
RVVHGSFGSGRNNEMVNGRSTRAAELGSAVSTAVLNIKDQIDTPSKTEEHSLLVDQAINTHDS